MAFIIKTKLALKINKLILTKLSKYLNKNISNEGLGLNENNY